ncbi:Protein kinase-like domain superfamily [Arabidopsis thaliana x Arabidopsis arenosa]|uniref:Protein kinase-like domain superfamily n=1 Tax=Arabidopsis thaliana x Arabidopsis arenosa TaxID=1240361 RepID=A0A8T2BR17_9BRAS|nr:Protein kinase-like domain superfamily [Arabidopsis thaliana x Arabidopsis arenosa]
MPPTELNSGTIVERIVPTRTIFRQDCGHPYFKLDCGKGFAELTISFATYRILEANYDSRIIRLARLDYIDNLCPTDAQNASFLTSVLPFAPHTEMLTIYYSCQKWSSLNAYFGQLHCEGDKKTITNYYGTRNLSSPSLYGSSGFLFDNLRGNCQKGVSIPVDGSASKDNLQKTLEKGFQVEHNQDCSRCIESKGACGYNQTTRSFVCYCKDGTYGNNCGSGKGSHGNFFNRSRIGEKNKTETTEPEGSYPTRTLYLRTSEENYKVVLKKSKGNGEDFINEVASMSRTSHQNIVSLLGFCSEGSKRAIIYEFLENGSLDKFISGKSSVNLDWMVLYSIALGVARDDNFCPKVSDFGLAKLCEKKESILSILDTRGTIGYIAPEMISRVYGNVSHKSDVYSYGMLVLDMIGARNKENANQFSASTTSTMYFPEWIYKDLEKGDDGRLNRNGIICEEEDIIKKMTLVSLWCIQPSPTDRPPMNRVVEMMEGSLDALEIPPRPVFQIPTMPLQEFSIFSEDISERFNSKKFICISPATRECFHEKKNRAKRQRRRRVGEDEVDREKGNEK